VIPRSESPAESQTAEFRAGSQAVWVRGVQKGFGEWPVLWDLDLTVGWGEFLVIFGANGAGKTTLLKVLSTQARPDGGEVWIGGVERGSDATAIRRMIGVVAHVGLLYEDMTCMENLLFYGRMYGLSNRNKALHRRANEVLQRVGLEGRRDQRVRALSHGMQKRLSIARAILHHPSILLLDEPESGLDQDALDMFGDLLGEWKESGRTVVMTTHNLEHGLAWGDRVAILSGGKIAYQEARRSLDVAGFRGTYRQFLGAAS
jgi:heme exporter protein A